MYALTLFHQDQSQEEVEVQDENLRVVYNHFHHPSFLELEMVQEIQAFRGSQELPQEVWKVVPTIVEGMY